jgi:hypothetical protein
LIQNIFAFLTFSIKVFLKEIIEKKDPEDYQDNKQFNQDYDPYTITPPGHISETLIIESEYPGYC